MTTGTQKTSYFLALALCLGGVVGLGLELYLASHGKSLCPNSACEVVGGYVRIGEPALLFFGAIFFLLLGGALFCGRRFPERPWLAESPTLLIGGAMAFDGTLLGFQFVTLEQLCVICISVGSVLGLIAIFYGLGRRRWLFILLALAAWGGGFLGSAVLQAPEVPNPGQQMAFYSRPAKVATERPVKMTLIFSLNCPHCGQVLEYLAQKNPAGVEFHFAVIDADEDTLRKIAYFQAGSAQTQNPFQLLLEAKGRPAGAGEAMPAKLPEAARQARIFLANLNLKFIPVLLVEPADNQRLLLSSREQIVGYFQQIGL